MLFGRLRVPIDRDSSRDVEKRTKSGLHSIIPVAPVRGGSPHRALLLLPPVELAPDEDEYAGLDRLDRPELDED